ncbi:MAG: hypothetical protein WAW96_00555 [Alphaproteobacteria bacterium]
MRAFGIFFDAGEWRSPFDEGVPVATETGAISEQKTFWVLGILLALLPITVAALKLLAVI